MNVTVDGHDVELAEDATILDAIQKAGEQVPALCYDERLTPTGSCRTCLVAIEQTEYPVPACLTPAFEGAVVRTDDPHATETVRGVLELLVSELPERALDTRSELAEACRLHGITESSFAGEIHHRGKDDSHPYVKLDADLCIACGLCVRMCDELQGTFALSLVERGFSTVVAPGVGESWAESACVACGACVDACPTEALWEPGTDDSKPIERVVTTTCGYCGVGCSLDIHVQDEAIAVARPTRGAKINRGHACSKGRFAHGFLKSSERLTHPLIRRNGSLERASWEEAIEFVAKGLGRVKRQWGPDAVALISSARCTNEENYLLQKLARVGLGTNNVDNCSRICHAPSAAGLIASLGLAGGTASFDDFDRAGCFFLAGANPTEAHPVVGARIKQRVIDGARLVVVDPRRIELAEYADLHLRPKPGTNVALFNALASALIDQGLCDEDFLKARANGYLALRRFLEDYSPEATEAITGVSPEQVRHAAWLYATSQGRTLVYGLGITEHAHGTDGVRALCNLGILTGSVGTKAHGGINALRGQNNVQGASDMGALPEFLPGYQPVADESTRARFETAYGTSIAAERGLRITEMFQAAIEGKLKAMWVVGEDIAQTDPDTERVEAALEACELVVSQELFLSRTAERADVVLPAAAFLEKDGSFVNFDRHVSRVRPVVRPPAQSTPDFEIAHLIAHALGTDLGCASPAEAFDEMAGLTPPFSGLSHRRLDDEGPLQWPCHALDRPPERTLYLSSFATEDGRAQLHAAPYLPPGEQSDADYPFVLITGRRLQHYNAGTMTRRTAHLELQSDESVEMNPADAGALGLSDRQWVEVSSRRSSVKAPLKLSGRIAQGQLFLAFHFPDVLANALTSDTTDTVTSCPEYKVTAVRVTAEKA
jgi:formate dehydrogenase major subunit